MAEYAKDGKERLKELVKAHGPIEAPQRFPKMAIANEGAPAKACMLSKTLLELHAHNHPLAHKANQHLLKMEEHFAELLQQAQSNGDIDSTHDSHALARRYQSDLLGLRVSAERDRVDAQAIAAEIASSLARL
jgi:hypothetical protein